MAVNYTQADPNTLYGVFSRRFGDEMKNLGWTGGTSMINPNYFGNAEMGESGTGEAMMANPQFLDFLKANNLSLQTGQSGNDIYGRLYQGDNLLSERNWQKNNSFDRFVDKAIPAVIAAGTGGILGQALGFIPSGVNPLQPSTWGGATASNTGVPFELGNMGTTGGASAGGAASPYSLAGSGAKLGGTATAGATSPYSLATGSMAPGTTGALLGNTLGAAQSGITATGAGLGLTGLGSILGGGIGDSIGAGLGSTIGSTIGKGVGGAVKDAVTGGQSGQQPGTGPGQAGGFNLGNLLGAISQMYQANQYQNSLDKLYGTLSDTGPYEEALRQELERRDSASGRRSQYGPREVELQAKMYDARSKNATTLAALTGNQNAALGSMLQGGLLAGVGGGLIDPSTGGLGQVGQDIWEGITDSDWWNDLFDFGG